MVNLPFRSDDSDSYEKKRKKEINIYILKYLPVDFVTRNSRGRKSSCIYIISQVTVDNIIFMAKILYIILDKSTSRLFISFC